MKMATEEPQQFCLRWHNYQSSLLATLPQLLDGDDLTDVTLCAGSRSLKAHRVVLSACSEYFKELFKELGASHHPVIVLPGVDFTDLCALVTFMYSGEVNIYEAQLASLLAMADTLHIRGLADFSNTSNLSPKPAIRTKRARMTDNQEITSRVRNKPTFAETEVYADWTMPALTNVDLNTENIVQDLSKRISDNDPPIVSTDHPGTTELPIKHENTSFMETNVTSEEYGAATDLTQGASDNLKVKAVSKMYTTCFICGKQLSNHYNLRVHMETHQNVQYACSACNHVSRSRDALRKHVSYRHPPVIDGTSPKKPAAQT